MADEWYWNVARNRVEKKGETGPAEDLLGPYPTEEAARNWRETNEARETAWKAQDEAWEGDDAGDG